MSFPTRLMKKSSQKLNFSLDLTDNSVYSVITEIRDLYMAALAIQSPRNSSFTGAKWACVGINRTVAQIHALLYLSPKPLNAEEIADTLSVARSNVSTSLKELQGWGVVKIVHVLGDRRDHFETLKDVWAMFRIILDERKKRETDPSLARTRRAESVPTRKNRPPLMLPRVNAWMPCWNSLS